MVSRDGRVVDSERLEYGCRVTYARCSVFFYVLGAKVGHIPSFWLPLHCRGLNNCQAYVSILLSS